jgi:hypothetical protein
MKWRPIDKILVAMIAVLIVVIAGAAIGIDTLREISGVIVALALGIGWLLVIFRTRGPVRWAIIGATVGLDLATEVTGKAVIVGIGGMIGGAIVGASSEKISRAAGRTIGTVIRVLCGLIVGLSFGSGGREILPFGKIGEIVGLLVSIAFWVFAAVSGLEHGTTRQEPETETGE